jgi:cyclopropane fatty-acyl-phospholipid synthase-like methyltransferase
VTQLSRPVGKEDMTGVRKIYDEVMADNVDVHDLVYPSVFGADQYIGQFSDNSADELVLMGRAMELPAGSHVLDVGCGRGLVARHMAANLGWRMTGIDLSSVPISRAQTAASAALQFKPEFVHGDIYRHEFGERFDGIYGTGAFCHFDAADLFARCATLLRPGGRLGFMERVRTGPISDDQWHSLTTAWCCPYVYTIDEYRELLESKGFTVAHVLDLTDSFRVWQRKSVTVRQELKDQIVALTSEDYYEASVGFAAYENDVTEAGLLGYTCIVAERR